MKLLSNAEEHKKAKSQDYLICECEHCFKAFNVKKVYITREQTKKLGHVRFCSHSCSSANIVKRAGIAVYSELACKQCGKLFNKLNADIRKTKLDGYFCSMSCASTHKIRNKKFGTQRSKLEIWLEKNLCEIFPELIFSFNEKSLIQSELDIYIPSLQLAFELNGLFHYEPVFGIKKLTQIQKNDHRKFCLCEEMGIEFHAIDTSSLKYFKDTNAQIYLDVITKIIMEKLK